MHWHAARYPSALKNFEESLTIHRASRNRYSEAKVLNNIGEVQARLGAHEEALAYYQQALPIARDIGDQRCEADSLNNIGTTFRRMGRYDESLIHHQRALALFEGIGVPEARTVRSRLEESAEGS